MNQVGAKFPHSPILHYAFSSWREKTMTKNYISTGNTDFFYNSMEGGKENVNYIRHRN